LFFSLGRLLVKQLLLQMKSAVLYMFSYEAIDQGGFFEAFFSQ